MQREVTNHALENYELISWKMKNCLIIFQKILTSKACCVQTERELPASFLD